MTSSVADDRVRAVPRAGRAASAAAGHEQLPWPAYGLDPERTHFAAGMKLRPPFRKLWKLFPDPSFIEFPPVIGYGRLYFGTHHGLVLAVNARSGRLLWARRTGSFVYAPAAVWHGTVYVGSYDHHFYALNAATGTVRWSYDAGHPISGAPTVLDGLVYFSTCGSCSSYEQNAHARRTYALDAPTGRLAWTFPDGEYSSLVADSHRAYLTGFTELYALAPA